MTRRLALPARVCEVCGAIFTRRRYEWGVLETASRFMRRRFCGRPCRDMARRKAGPCLKCMHCREILRRKRWANGKLEVIAAFRVRLFCDMTCKRLFMEEPGNVLAWKRVMRARTRRRLKAAA